MKKPLLSLFTFLCAATLTARAQSGNLENGLAWKITDDQYFIKKS